MSEQEKSESVSKLLKQFEDSLIKDMTKYKEMFERCKMSTQYQLDQNFRGSCDSIEGYLADIERNLKALRQRKN
jgi:predicted transcriptional regulator